MLNIWLSLAEGVVEAHNFIGQAVPVVALEVC